METKYVLWVISIYLDWIRIPFWLEAGKGLSEPVLVEGKEGSKRFSGTLETEVQLTRDLYVFNGEDK